MAITFPEKQPAGTLSLVTGNPITHPFSRRTAIRSKPRLTLSNLKPSLGAGAYRDEKT
jgi:hypothetical protein